MLFIRFRRYRVRPFRARLGYDQKRGDVEESLKSSLMSALTPGRRVERRMRPDSQVFTGKVFSFSGLLGIRFYRLTTSQ